MGIPVYVTYCLISCIAIWPTKVASRSNVQDWNTLSKVINFLCHRRNDIVLCVKRVTDDMTNILDFDDGVSKSHVYSVLLSESESRKFSLPSAFGKGIIFMSCLQEKVEKFTCIWSITNEMSLVAYDRCWCYTKRSRSCSAEKGMTSKGGVIIILCGSMRMFARGRQCFPNSVKFWCLLFLAVCKGSSSTF